MPFKEVDSQKISHIRFSNMFNSSVTKIVLVSYVCTNEIKFVSVCSCPYLYSHKK